MNTIVIAFYSLRTSPWQRVLSANEWWARCHILSRWSGWQSEILRSPIQPKSIVNYLLLLATYATALRIVFAWYVFIHISKYLPIRDEGQFDHRVQSGYSLPKVFCLSVSRAFLSRKALGMAFRQSLKYFSLIRFELNCTAGTDYNSDVRTSSTFPKK